MSLIGVEGLPVGQSHSTLLSSQEYVKAALELKRCGRAAALKPQGITIEEPLHAARAKKKAVTDFSATAFDINRLSL